MFETLFTILTRLETTGDCSFTEEDRFFDVTLNDFVGFTDDWDEIYRDYKDAEMVDALFEVLNRADSNDGKFYTTYRFADCSLRLGYSSYDI